MCGIVGFIEAGAAGDACLDVLIDGLRRLEYRGYDSAGVAIVESSVDGARLAIQRAGGKLENLVRKVRASPILGAIGVGHTRWATHGRPTEDNAHPHRSGTVAVVHNGIIENHVELKRELIARGHSFSSETDTEVIAHLIDHLRRREGLPLVEATRRATSRLHGAYAIVVVDASEPDVIVGARLASPLVVGLGKPGEGRNYLASDVSAILQHTRDFVFLEEGQLAAVRADSVEIIDIAKNERVPLKSTYVTWTPAMAEKGGFKHFMLKEIHEQPRAVADTLRGRVSLERASVELPEFPITAADLQRMSQLYIVACGTSWHAGIVGRYLLEDLAGLASHVELASEFRYRQAPIDERTIVIAISQSGETADTLAAIREAKKKGAKIFAVVNVIGSSIAREADGALYTHAGPEIGVASTKAFTTQLVALHLLALRFGELLGRIDEPTRRAELEALMHAPTLLEQMLKQTPEAKLKTIAETWHEVHSMLFLGRGILYPLALEGALKLKEISYIHAEGQAAGEMKHGPIALIDRHVPTVVLNPRDPHFAKVRSNLAEVRARSGPVLLLATEGDEEADGLADFVLSVPAVGPHLLPLVTALPLQLLAYTMADFKGTDVDQPRNLAKSVTVE